MLRMGLEDFGRAPVGGYVAGETFVHFCASPTLWGVILWGRPGEPDAFQLGRSLVLELMAPAVPHVSIVDASRVDAGDPRAFELAERYVTGQAAKLGVWVQMQALVRPRGLGGAIISGAFDVLPRPYPVRVVDDAADGFTWFAAGGWSVGVADGPALLAEMYAEASSTPQVVGALRAFLDGHLTDVELPEAARALGMSDRTLQRKLADAATTFKDELAEARVRAARRLLRDGDTPLTRIAYDVGCASLQHFSAMFRKRTGESPSAFRARHRS